LIPALADRFHVIAPDYPGFGNSDMPDPANFSYTFDKISEVVENFFPDLVLSGRGRNWLTNPSSDDDCYGVLGAQPLL
jgi:pimeloyl-ACP methyl ester carboxylesterase